jgi:hypothetical protein
MDWEGAQKIEKIHKKVPWIQFPNGSEMMTLAHIFS